MLRPALDQKQKNKNPNSFDPIANPILFTFFTMSELAQRKPVCHRYKNFSEAELEKRAKLKHYPSVFLYTQLELCKELVGKDTTWDFSDSHVNCVAIPEGGMIPSETLNASLFNQEELRNNIRKEFSGTHFKSVSHTSRKNSGRLSFLISGNAANTAFGAMIISTAANIQRQNSAQQTRFLPFWSHTINVPFMEGQQLCIRYGENGENEYLFFIDHNIVKTKLDPNSLGMLTKPEDASYSYEGDTTTYLLGINKKLIQQLNTNPIDFFLDYLMPSLCSRLPQEKIKMSARRSSSTGNSTTSVINQLAITESKEDTMEISQERLPTPDISMKNSDNKENESDERKDYSSTQPRRMP